HRRPNRRARPRRRPAARPRQPGQGERQPLAGARPGAGQGGPPVAIPRRREGPTREPAARETPLGGVRALPPLCLAVLVGFPRDSMMVPLFVPMRMLPSNGYLPASATTAQRTMVLGLLLALYPLGQVLGAPVLGALTDRHGRKPVLVASLGVTSACYLVICLGLQLQLLPLLMVACLVAGLGESNVAITQSVVADVTSGDERGRLFGYIYSVESVGYIVGPVVGGALAARFGYAVPFWAILALLVITLLWVRLALQETHQPRPGLHVDVFKAFANLATVFSDRPIRRLYLVNFLFYLASFGFFRVILMYMVDEWHWTESEETLAYAA